MNELLVFRAGTCELALPVSCVKEVVAAVALSSPASTLTNIEGFLNLRGQVVPVVDLAAVLSVEQPATATTDFLIVASDDMDRIFAVRANGETRLVQDAEPASEETSTEMVSGMFRVGTKIVSALNPAAISPHSHSDRIDQNRKGDEA